MLLYADKMTEEIYDDVDINECKELHADCSQHATCINIPGGYNCTCKPGYIGNGHICHGKWREVLLSKIYDLIFIYTLHFQP